MINVRYPKWDQGKNKVCALRIDNSGWQLPKQSGDNPGSPQGILSSNIPIKMPELFYISWYMTHLHINKILTTCQ